MWLGARSCFQHGRAPPEITRYPILPLLRISLQPLCYLFRSTRLSGCLEDKKRAMQRYPSFEIALGKQIAKAREAKGLSQRELSALVRRRNNYIQLIESGHQPVSASGLVEIAQVLEASASTLIDQAERAAPIRLGRAITKVR